MEDTTSHVNTVITTDPEKFLKSTSLPHYKSCMMFGDHFAIILMGKSVQKKDKPIQVGGAILELSKLHMQKFHYETMVPLFGRPNIRMMMTDTDSFINRIRCQDLHHELSKIQGLLDTSNYPVDHPLFSTANAKVLGKFKDECGGLQMVGLELHAVKNYSAKLANESEIKHLKGISRSVQKMDLAFQDWVNNRDTVTRTVYPDVRFLQQNHAISTVENKKVFSFM
jgi:hypothetical protein